MAVTKVASLNACLNLIQGLGDAVGMNSPELVREDIALYRGLKSAQNTQGLSDIRTINNDGKCLTVQFDYMAPDCGPAEDGAIDLCGLESNATTSPKTTVTTTLGRAKHKTREFDKTTFKKICETQDQVVSHFLVQDAIAILRDMQVDLYGAMAAEAGSYADGTDSAAAPKTINLLNNDGCINKGAFATIKGAFGRHPSSLIGFGGQSLMRAQDILNITDRNGGVSFNPDLIMSGTSIFSDYKIDDALAGATNDSFALFARPGAYRLIEGYTNVGDYRELTDPRVLRTVVTILGVDFDFYSVYDPECQVYKYILQKQYDLFCLPEDCYDDCLDYTSKLLFKIGCGEHGCADTFC